MKLCLNTTNEYQKLCCGKCTCNWYRILAGWRDDIGGVFSCYRTCEWASKKTGWITWRLPVCCLKKGVADADGMRESVVAKTTESHLALIKGFEQATSWWPTSAPVPGIERAENRTECWFKWLMTKRGPTSSLVPLHYYPTTVPSHQHLDPILELSPLGQLPGLVPLHQYPTTLYL